MDINSVKELCVAIVDDEENIRETVSYALKKEGYITISFPDGATAWEAFRKKLPDLVVLDIIMPRMDGLELCRKLRSVSESLPLIFLTSKDEEFDRILGLEIGGDDYLCKPFSMRELIARIKVLFRRMSHQHEHTNDKDILSYGDLKLNLQCYTVQWKDKNIPLTVTEFMLLRSLIKYPGHVKTRDQLMKEAYPNNTYVSDRTIDSHIKRLRQKFVHIAPDYNDIETVYGIGYRYKVG
ncbi:MAG: response regulator transcription factor [Spirochaetales bacterium]|nr:response regulator transcription factor [Spirochaetales bacterium]